MKKFNNLFNSKLPDAFKRFQSSTNSQQSLKSWKELPGPKSLPILGQLHNFLPGGLFHKCTGYKLHKELYEKHGNFVKVDGVFGGPPMLYLFDAEGAAQILRSENWMPIRPPIGSLDYYRNVYKRKMKNQTHRVTGLAVDQGEIWKDFRTSMNPLFMNPKNVQSYEHIIDDVTQDMVNRLNFLRDDNNFIRSDFAYEANLFTLEAIAAVGLGERINSLDPNLPKDSPVNKLFTAINEFSDVSDELDFQPNLWRLYPTRNYHRMMKIYEEIEDLCGYFVKRSIDKLKSGVMLRYKGGGILEKIIVENKHYATLMISDMLFGGIHTSSNTLLSTLYLLAKHPDKQEKLREEIMLKSGRVYLKACIKEAMRRMPVVTGNIRTTTKEYHVLGYRIPKDMIISFGHQLLCQMDSHFPRASEYIPERWLVPKEDPLYYGNAHPFAYSPFGFGVRSCIGRRIVELELEVFISKLVKNFRVGWDGPDPCINYIFINNMVGPFYFTLNPL